MIGRQPARAAMTADDIGNNTIDSNKIINSSIVAADIGALDASVMTGIMPVGVTGGSGLNAVSPANLASGVMPVGVTGGSGLDAVVAGKILQLVSDQDNNPASTISTTSASWVTSGLNIDITPSLASSKILLMFQSGVGYANIGESHRQFYRGSTALGAGGYGMAVVGPVGGFMPWGLTWIDSPNTTSSTNYSVWHKADNNSITSYITWGTSYWNFIAMEIAA